MNLARRFRNWAAEQWILGRVVWPAVPARWRRSWRDVRNRGETVWVGSDAESRVCGWEWSSYLTVCQRRPRRGGQLLRKCLEEAPVRLRPLQARGRAPADPRLSIVIPFRGGERRNQLECVLRSWAGQDREDWELLVVTDRGGTMPLPVLPDWIRLVALDSNDALFPKSRFLNAGARAARADCLLLHDADIVVPANYAAQLIGRLQAGWDAVHPLRFLFYLDEAETAKFMESDGRSVVGRVADVRQNFAGGSVAVRRTAYWAIGGMNESFAGWGLEDVDFYQRLETRKLFRGRYAAALHLWHAADRRAFTPGNRELYERESALSAVERIQRLTARLNQGPAG